MKNKLVSTILYSLSFILILFYLYIEFISKNSYIPLIRIILLIIIVFLTYFGGYFLTKYKKIYKNICYKLNLYIWFILYLILIFKLTLFDSYFFRNGFLFVKWNKAVLYDYYYNVVNFIPFRMIIKLFCEYFDGDLTLSLLLNNIVGNFIAFMPFSFFLPRISKKENNTKYFIFTMIIIVSFVEITQFLTLSGTFDIDDYILNISGAYLIYKLLKKEKFYNLIEKILQIR